jgi:CheY-like chemotaxis protein
MVMPAATPSSPPILVVEDDLATREALHLVLTTEGYSVLTAGDGRDALEQLRNGVCPGLILLDLMMPGMDGWQFRHEQQRDSRLADIPVIVCSATLGAKYRTAELQAQAYLEKPFEPRQLLLLIREFYPG